MFISIIIIIIITPLVIFHALRIYSARTKLLWTSPNALIIIIVVVIIVIMMIIIIIIIISSSSSSYLIINIVKNTINIDID